MTASASTTLGELSLLVGGSLDGDASIPITGAVPLDEVCAGQIAFIDHAERLDQLSHRPAAAALVPEGVRCAKLPTIAVANVHAAFATIVQHFRPSPLAQQIGLSRSAVISLTAVLGEGVNVHPGATIGDNVRVGDRCHVLPGAHLLPGCRIGNDVVIGPSVVLYESTVVGDRTIIHGGAVLGAHGFGFRPENGRHVPAAQLGFVEIGADVEIGANVTIDRGTYGATRIGEGTKIDNLVQIAHNCQIGRHNLICSQVGIAGSSTTGDYVVMAGQVGIRDHVNIGNGVMLSAMTGVSNDVPDGAKMMGIPATRARDQKLRLAALAKLPDMRKEFYALRRQVEELEQRLSQYTTDRAA